MLEFLTVVGLVVLFVVTVVVTTVWLVLRRLRRSRVVATARTVIAVGTPLLATCRPAAVRNPAAAQRVLRLSRAQWALRRCVADAARAGAYLGDVPAMLPRLQAETDRLNAGLTRLSGAGGRELMVSADRHLATLRDLSDAVTATRVLPAAHSTLSDEAEEAAHGLRLYAAAYAELTGVSPG